MRPIRTIVPLALCLVALAVAGCQSRPDQPSPPAPAQKRSSACGRSGRWGKPGRSYGAAELDLYKPAARRVGPNAYEVGATGAVTDSEQNPQVAA